MTAVLLGMAAGLLAGGVAVATALRWLDARITRAVTLPDPRRPS